MNVSVSNYLPKAHSPNTITLGVKAMSREFGGHRVYIPPFIKRKITSIKT